MKTPYPFQVAAVQQALTTSGFLVADECGLGKTITAIETAKAARKVYNDPTVESWRCLVVCPPSLIIQWVNAVGDQDPGWQVHVPGRLLYAYLNVRGYVIMSYYDLQSVPVLARLSALVWDCMIVDEAHRIKNRKTGMSKNVKSITAARKIALTGTPMEKNPADLWSILNFLDNDEFPAYWGWVYRHLVVTDGFMDWEKHQVGGPKDPIAFSTMLRPYMIRRTKDEVAPELPEKIVIEEPVLMDTRQQSIYDQIRKSTDIEVTVEDQHLLIQNVLTLITRLQQVSAYPPLLDFEGVKSGKLEWLTEFLADHQDEPTVIFTRFRGLAIHLADTLGCGMIIGGGERPVGSTGLLVGTIDAMGEGLNLQWAKNAVFVDAHWSTIKMTQAIDRIHRIDIKEPKNIYLLWSTREDKLVLDALNHKWSESELVYYYLHPGAPYEH